MVSKRHNSTISRCIQRLDVSKEEETALAGCYLATFTLSLVLEGSVEGEAFLEGEGCYVGCRRKYNVITNTGNL